MSRQAQCPSCGNAVVFEFDASVVLVCPSCHSLLVRQGARIENAGRVAEVVATQSLLSLGDIGSWNRESFQIIGRVQVQHAAGVWDEWRIAFTDGRYGWIAESLGRRHLLVDSPVKDLPSLQKYSPGFKLTVPSLMVTEIGTARAHTLEGELPQDLRPGETWAYVDLAGPKGAFATIDFGGGDTARAMFLGSAATLEQMGLGHVSRETRRANAEAKALQCKECGGALTLRLPDVSQRIACPYCRTLMSVEGDLKALEVSQKQEKLSFKPTFELGAKARFDGAIWVVMGAMERSSGSDTYRWREYLLHEASRGFRWLSEDRYHWCLIDNAHAGDLETLWSGKTFNGTTYKRFVTVQTRVECVIGEFPWAVEVGESTTAIDYIAPPSILSEEMTPTEYTVSMGRYVATEDVEKAFGMKARSLFKPFGVHAAQPNPFKARVAPAWTVALAAATLLLLTFMVLHARSSKVIYESTVNIAQGALPSSPEATFISQPFTVSGRGNLEIKVEAPVENSWLYLDGTVAENGGDQYGDFEAEVGFFHGVDDGEAWTEGSRQSVAYVGRVPAGQYTLRLTPQWGALLANAAVPKSYRVFVRRGVPRPFYLLLSLLAILAWPVILTVRSSTFEGARWAESDG